MKYLLLMALGMALWWGWRRWWRPSSQGTQPGPGETMLACRHCGVHVPVSDVVRDAQGRPYCGAAHRALGPRAGDAA
ncbi:MAG: PP0621 family protein [Azovibrio sp.]|nr:PP0621 family protein [Azovibrio sp.]